MVMQQVAQRIKLRFHHHRDPEVRSYAGLAALKRRRRHPHNGIRALVEFDRPANNVRIRTEMRLPETITDHGHWRAPWHLIFRRKKAAPQKWPHTEDVKIVRGSHHRRKALRFPFACQADWNEVACGNACETPLSIAHGLHVGIRKREGVLTRFAQGERYHFVRLVESGNWIQQRCVDPAEDCGVCSDS